MTAGDIPPVPGTPCLKSVSPQLGSCSFRMLPPQKLTLFSPWPLFNQRSEPEDLCRLKAVACGPLCVEFSISVSRGKSSLHLKLLLDQETWTPQSQLLTSRGKGGIRFCWCSPGTEQEGQAVHDCVELGAWGLWLGENEWKWLQHGDH